MKSCFVVCLACWKYSVPCKCKVSPLTVTTFRTLKSVCTGFDTLIAMLSLVSTSRTLQQKGSRIKPSTMQLTHSTNRSTTATLKSSSKNLSSARVGHLTDAHSFLLRSQRPVLYGVSLAETFFPFLSSCLISLPSSPCISFLMSASGHYMLQTFTELQSFCFLLDFIHFYVLLKTSRSSQDFLQFLAAFLGGIWVPFNMVSFLHSHKQTC